MAHKTFGLMSCFYWLVALSYAFNMQYFDPPWHSLHKAMPIIFLALLSFYLTNRHLSRWLFAALFSSACGDILLASDIDHAFLLGLSAFAVAHICYCMGFWRYVKWSVKPLPIVALLLTFLFSVCLIIVPHTQHLLFPVLGYMALITLMAVLAIFARQHHYWLSIGALLFVLSDSLIALNKFVVSLPFEHLLVMVSYYLAQYCLFYGCSKQEQHDGD